MCLAADRLTFQDRATIDRRHRTQYLDETPNIPILIKYAHNLAVTCHQIRISLGIASNFGTISRDSNGQSECCAWVLTLYVHFTPPRPIWVVKYILKARGCIGRKPRSSSFLSNQALLSLPQNNIGTRVIVFSVAVPAIQIISTRWDLQLARGTDSDMEVLQWRVDGSKHECA